MGFTEFPERWTNIKVLTDLVIAGPDLYQRIYVSIITIDQEVGVYFSVWFPFRCPHERLTRRH